MKMMFGCLSIVAAASFAITFLTMLLFAHDTSWAERLAVSAMMATVFPLILATAVMLLAWRDKANFRLAKRNVKRQLSKRSDVGDSEFCEPFPQHDPRLLLEVRNAIAAFFSVPSFKIHPADSLDDDFAWHALWPSIVFFVTYRVLAAYKVPLPSNRVVAFPRSDRIDGFADEMQKLMQWMWDVEREGMSESAQNNAGTASDLPPPLKPQTGN